MTNLGPHFLSVVLALTLSDLPPVPAPADTTHAPYPWAKPTSWDITIARDDEPGPRFIMSGQVFGPDSMPAPGVDLYVYHADIQGYYARKRGQMNRLAGVLRTNERGEYRVRSTLPGQYEAYAAHVHFDVWEKGHPTRATFANLYTMLESPRVPEWGIQKTASTEWNTHMALIAVDSSGVYWCHHDLKLSNMTEFPASYDSKMRALRKREEKAARH